MNSRRAFTLVELLISASLSAIVILGVYSAFGTGSISYNKIDTSFNTYQTAMIGLGRIESDLKNSYVYLQSDSGFSGTATGMSFFSIVDEFDNQGKSICQVSRIKYDLQDKILKRISSKGLDALIDPATESKEIDLFGNLESISFSYQYPTGHVAQPYDWQDSWPKTGDDTQKNTLPIAVKVEITVKEKDTSASFSKVIPLPPFNIIK